MNLLQAFILAVIEGLTEFLPVSSTGHMIIGSSVMGIATLPFTKLYTVVIQFGAILSVVALYWKRFLPQGKQMSETIDFYKKIIIAFIPSVIFGVLFKKKIDMLMENVVVVAAALLIGGIIFILLDKWFHEAEERGESKLTSDKKAFTIGLFQVLAMIPGVSRSAATIIGGLTQRLNKKAAAEFSFFLAVPTMAGATVKDLYDFYKDGTLFADGQIGILVFGNIVAFIVAFLAIRSFIGYLTKHGFKIFGYYRIVVGLSILILYFLGYNLTIL